MYVDEEIDDSPGSVDEVEESEAATPLAAAIGLADVLQQMGEDYRADPTRAVRSQSFIKLLHAYVASQLSVRLTKFAVRRGIQIRSEAKILGSTKPKDVDIAVLDPDNGPLVIIGIRSQMSSVGKNVLTYYEGIVGECLSLQDRFPMATHGYIYLHPLNSIMVGKEKESIAHPRYARMYAAVSGRIGVDYKNQRGIFDQFAYMVVDFDQTPPTLRDDIVRAGVPATDMSIDTFVDRIVETTKDRMLFWDIFD